MMAMITTEPEIPLSSLSDVTAPTLVMQGDRDEVTVEHSLVVAGVLRKSVRGARPTDGAA
jgi:hypothetical protein